MAANFCAFPAGGEHSLGRATDATNAAVAALLRPRAQAREAAAPRLCTAGAFLVRLTVNDGSCY